MFFFWVGPFVEFGDNFEITKENVPKLSAEQKPKI